MSNEFIEPDYCQICGTPDEIHAPECIYYQTTRQPVPSPATIQGPWRCTSCGGPEPTHMQGCMYARRPEEAPLRTEPEPVPAPATLQCVHCAGTIYNHETGCPALPYGTGVTVRPAHTFVHGPVPYAPTRGTCPECGAMAGGHEQSCGHFVEWLGTMPVFATCARCNTVHRISDLHICQRATLSGTQWWDTEAHCWVDTPSHGTCGQVLDVAQDKWVDAATPLKLPADFIALRVELDALRKRVAVLELELSAKKGELE